MVKASSHPYKRHKPSVFPKIEYFKQANILFLQSIALCMTLKLAYYHKGINDNYTVMKYEETFYTALKNCCSDI